MHSNAQEACMHSNAQEACMHSNTWTNQAQLIEVSTISLLS